MKKQRVLVTAGGSGIGRAMAEAFSDAGASVWIMDISAEAASDCPDAWRRTIGDVSDSETMESLFRQIEEDWGGLDVLCANAGTAGPTAPVEEQSPGDFRDCVSVNLDGAFLAARGALPLMKREKSGAIVFTTSTAGLYGYPLRAPYAAAKWAVIGLMKTVAMEAGPHGIRANAIAPGCVEGPRIDGVISREAAKKDVTPERLRKAYEGGTSMRTLVEARDIAAMAVFLASDQARYVSGQVIAVDGHTENPDPRLDAESSALPAALQME